MAGDLWAALDRVSHKPVSDMMRGYIEQSGYPLVRVERLPGGSVRLTQRLNRSASVQPEGPVEVEVRGRVAILRGLVATDHARDLAAQLVLLEPGVDQVDNQLQVPGESESSPE